MEYACKLGSGSKCVAAAVLGVALAAAGCGNETRPPAGTGSLALGLQLASGTSLDSLDWTITGPSSFSRTGTIDLGHSTTVSTLISALPAGSGFSITLSGGNASAGVTCGGTAGFSVGPRQTTSVTVAIACHEPARTGSVLVTGALNLCPVVDGVGANPAEASVGASIAVEALAHDSDGVPAALTYQWAATGGTLSSASVASPTFTCTAPGPATLTLTVSDGDATCVASASIVVTCTTPVCTPSCDDQNPCTTDTCLPSFTCQHTPVADGSLCQSGNLKVKLLGFNDFHGHISTGTTVSGRPAGGAGVFAAYLKAAEAGIEDQTLIVHAGDHIGASPASSALLQDEPSIMFLNQLANGSCSYADKANPACNLVGTLGNHEFDEGKAELLRLLDGGNYVSGPFLEDPYKGARFPYVSANVVDEVTGRPIIPPYVIKKIKGVPIAFVGAVLKDTPTIVTPTGVAGLRFLDEADAANSYVPELKAMGVKALVLLIHQGGSTPSYGGPTDAAKVLTGPQILDVVHRLDSEFDVVVSGHSHQFANAIVNNNSGKPMLVTQAFSFSTAYGDIDLLVDPVSHDIVAKTARIVTTFGDVAPGNNPDPAAVALTTQAETIVAPLVNRVVGFASAMFTRAQNAAGESGLGDIIADAQRASGGTQFCFMNPGGIRADLAAGTIHWGDLFTIQPFGNSLVTMNMTGAQLKALLEQQWQSGGIIRTLQISGLTYTWKVSGTQGNRIIEIRNAATNAVLDPSATYTVTTNNFLAAGGDGFTTFTGGTNQVGGAIDLDALVAYTMAHNPLPAPTAGRITTIP